MLLGVLLSVVIIILMAMAFLSGGSLFSLDRADSRTPQEAIDEARRVKALEEQRSKEYQKELPSQ